MTDDYTVEHFEEIFASENWRLYWLGKRPHTRHVTEQYLLDVRTRGISRAEICRRNGITSSTIGSHIRQLQDLYFIPREDYRELGYRVRRAYDLANTPRNYYVSLGKRQKRRWLEDQIGMLYQTEVDATIRYITELRRNR